MSYAVRKQQQRERYAKKKAREFAAGLTEQQRTDYQAVITAAFGIDLPESKSDWFRLQAANLGDLGDGLDDIREYLRGLWPKDIKVLYQVLSEVG